jgi:glycosyltransferase involved in cell wall biosynthesis
VKSQTVLLPTWRLVSARLKPTAIDSAGIAACMDPAVHGVKSRYRRHRTIACAGAAETSASRRRRKRPATRCRSPRAPSRRHWSEASPGAPPIPALDSQFSCPFVICAQKQSTSSRCLRILIRQRSGRRLRLPHDPRGSMPGIDPVKQTILVVTRELPWPPRRNGVSLRFFPLLQHLSVGHQVELIVIDDPGAERFREKFASIGRIRFLYSKPIDLPPLLRKSLTLLLGLSPAGMPLGSIRHRNMGRVCAAICEQIRSREYSAVLFAGVIYPKLALKVRRAFPSLRIVYDFVDSPILHAQRAFPDQIVMSLLQRYGEWKWKRIETRVRRAFDTTIYISAADANAVGVVPGAVAATVIPNGVLVDKAALIRHESASSPLVVGFLGNMAYLPNILAARRLAADIMPCIKRSISGVSLTIIGRDPAPEIEALRSESVTVTGTVSNIWEHVNGVRVFVFPMISGAGLQNKILEAMYAGIPVVTTPIAAEGVGATPGSEIFVAEDDAGIAELAVALLSDQKLWDATSEAGKRFIHKHRSWETILPQYESALLGQTHSLEHSPGAAS